MVISLAKLRFAFASPTGSGAWWLYWPEWTDLTVLRAAGAQLMQAVRPGRVFPIPFGTSSPGTALTLLDAFDRLLGTLA